MDPLTHLLDGPRAKRAFALRALMDPGWSISVRDRAPLTVLAMIRGEAWLLADGDRFRLGPGDVAIVSGPGPYVVCDDPARSSDFIIHPGQRCTSPVGRALDVSMSHGIRTWGNSASGATAMLIGTYENDAEVGGAVTAALPRVALLGAGHVDQALTGLLERTLGIDAPGQGVVIDRLLDVLLIHAVRDWARLHPGSAHGWLAGRNDPLVERVLGLFHGAPADPWTLDVLARELRVSRATLASRFRNLVGEPPMAYLAGWRMLLASELLAEPGLGTAQIADRVGYGSPFALSTAFKRRFGMSPTAYRQHTYPREAEKQRADIGTGNALRPRESGRGTG